MPDFISANTVQSIKDIIAILTGLGIVIDLTPGIKIQPVRWLIKQLGNLLNHDIRDQLDKLQKDFTEHKVDSWRNEILQFARSCTNRQRHTKEDFDHVIETIDKYKRYIKANELINGQVDVAEEYIKEIYKQCLRENDFIPDKPPKNYVEQERKERGKA